MPRNVVRLLIGEQRLRSMWERLTFRVLLCATAGAVLVVPLRASAAPQRVVEQTPMAQAPVAKQVGVIKSIDGTAITLITDTGASIAVQVAANAKMVRVAPGQTDLKTAPPIQLSDLHIGDRILVRGQPSSDGKSFQ